MPNTHYTTVNSLRYDFYADVLDSFPDALGIGETNTLVYPETSWAVKLFLIAMKTPGLRGRAIAAR